MDEQEVPIDSSEEISSNKSPSSEEIVPASSEGESRVPESDKKQDKDSSSDATDTKGIEIAITPEDLPTMHWSDVYAELAEFEGLEDDNNEEQPQTPEDQQPSSQTGPLVGLEDAINWLEQLAAGQGMPIDEMPTLVTAQPVSTASTNKTGDPDSPSDSDLDTQGLELDSDPMAWLEQLAVDQSSPLEELPSVADRLLASEIVSQNEIPPSSTINDPYDVNRALTYLEQLAVAQGIDLSKISFDANQPVTSLNSALNIIDGLALSGMVLTPDYSESEAFVGEEVQAPSASEDVEHEGKQEIDHWSDVSDSMPDDPQEALDWLSSLDEEADGVETEVVLEADTLAPEATTPDPAAEPEGMGTPDEAQIDIDVLGEMPDDPDEAVAWMENLATSDSQKPAAEIDPQIPQEDVEPASGTQPTVDPQADPDSDNLQDAISEYQNIINENAATEDVVAALEEIIATQGETPKILRLLGDAYMQIGETQKAIATYRKGFDHF